MLGDQPRAVDVAHVLLVRGDLPAIRGALAAVGARVEMIGQAPRAAAESLDTGQGKPAPVRLHVGRLILDLAAHEAWLAGRRLHCTVTEFGLLACLAERPGQVFTRRQLLAHLRESADFVTVRTIDTHIGNLRRKLGETASPSLIETVYGIGYKLRAETPQLAAIGSADSLSSA